MLVGLSLSGYLQAFGIPIALILLIGVIGGLMNVITGNSWKQWWGPDDR